MINESMPWSLNTSPAAQPNLRIKSGLVLEEIGPRIPSVPKNFFFASIILTISFSIN